MAIRVKPIHWRLLAMHLFAVPFLIIGGRQIQVIQLVGVVAVYQQGGMKAVVDYPLLTPELIAQAHVGPLYAWSLAILIACLGSALVVWRRRESRLIPLLVMIGAIGSSWSHYYNSKLMNRVLAFLRWPFESLPLAARLGIVGAALVAVGLLLLLWPLRWRDGAGVAATPPVAP